MLCFKEENVGPVLLGLSELRQRCVTRTALRAAVYPFSCTKFTVCCRPTKVPVLLFLSECPLDGAQQIHGNLDKER